MIYVHMSVLSLDFIFRNKYILKSIFIYAANLMQK